jgi:hypothetical protein
MEEGVSRALKCLECQHYHDDEEEYAILGNYCDWCETLNFENDPEGDWMSKDGQAPWRAATVIQAVNGNWGVDVWDGKKCMTVVWKDSEEKVREYMSEFYPQFAIIPLEEFQTEWRKLIGMPKARLLGPGGGIDKMHSKPYSPRLENKRPFSSKFELLEGETPQTLIAPVAFAKRIGVPPQYVYQAVSKGRIQTVGERPKRATIADLCKYFRKEVT